MHEGAISIRPELEDYAAAAKNISLLGAAPTIAVGRRQEESPVLESLLGRQ